MTVTDLLMLAGYWVLLSLFVCSLYALVKLHVAWPVDEPRDGVHRRVTPEPPRLVLHEGGRDSRPDLFDQDVEGGGAA